VVAHLVLVRPYYASRMSKPKETAEQHVPDDKMLAAAVVGDADRDIVHMEACIRAAQLTADVAALDRLLANDVLFTGPDGVVGTKAEDLKAHGSGLVRFRTHLPAELRMRSIGTDVVVTSLLAQLEVEVAGKLIEGDYRYTRVWARESGGYWRVVAGHVSQVQSPNQVSPQ
jgi:ketosteroid isomerase-like protein